MTCVLDAEAQSLFYQHNEALLELSVIGNNQKSGTKTTPGQRS